MRRCILAGLALMIAVSASSAGALPPAAAGAIASDDVEFLANVPVSGAIGARILGDTMYVTGVMGLQIFDVSSDIPVPLGALPLPHFGNEDVDTDGEILLISADNVFSFPQIRLYVIDVSNPTVPLLLSTIQVPSGHTVSCINDCSYAWLAGARTVRVVDLRDPSDPQVVASFDSRVGSTHDVQVDDAGWAWIVGTQGIAAYTTQDPTDPQLKVIQNGSFHNNFILHNSWRPHAAAATPATLADDVIDIDKGELVLVTEENWFAPQNGLCNSDGRFQTGWLRTVGGTLQLEKLDDVSVGSLTISDDRKPLAALCSAHYFSYRDDGIVAVSWYEQGMRFYDVSDPREIRQVGYYMPAVTEMFSAVFHRDVLYTIDNARGIDVLRFTATAGAPTVYAPALNAPSGATVPSHDWGWACRISVV